MYCTSLLVIHFCNNLHNNVYLYYNRFVNHNLYWSTMAANKDNGTSQSSGSLLTDIEASFGSFGEFQKLFTDQALALFGSGKYSTTKNCRDLT